MKRYYEKKIILDKELKLEEIADLCYDEKYFCLYENGGEIAIGMGGYIDISVTSSEIIRRTNGKIDKVIIKELCTDIEMAMEQIDLEAWRLYGIGNFSLARYAYGLDCAGEGEELFHFFIPKAEYRITEKEVLLRSLEKEKLVELEKNLKKIFDVEKKSDRETFVDPGSVIDYDEEYYKSIVANGVDEIKNGKYQKVILSRKVPIDKRLDMKKTYIRGRKVNTPARSYWCRLGFFEVAGFSPETVAEIDSEGNVYTFPLAGTRALTEDPEKNKKLRNDLLHDTKEIAEHAISVKLAEEEMKQVCEEDSVVVTEYMSVMERGTVQHLGSRLKGKLKKGCNSWHALCKLFPAVTASGIPKREAIEAIGRIEKEARQLYSGSVMTYDSDGALDAALVLRSIFQTDKENWVRVGAGIVDLSNPEREFIETQEKVSSIAKELILKRQ